MPDETYEDSNEPSSGETEEKGAVQYDGYETSSPDGIFGSGIEIPPEEEKDNKYPILPMAAITEIIDPSYRGVGFDVHGSSSDTTYTVKGGTWLYDNGSNALFCSEWEELPPNDNAKIQFYGLMEENESGLSFSAAWAYKCIKGAKTIWNDSAYSALTERMKLFAINRAMLQENEGHYYTSYRTPAAGEYSTKEQAEKMMKMINAIYDAAKASSETLPTVTNAEIKATLIRSKYYSGSDYILGEYSLDTEGVTATVASGSTPGVTATVTGTTLIVSIPSSMMSSGGAVSATVNLSVAAKTINTMLLYEITTQNPSYQLLCTLGAYECSAEGTVTIGGVLDTYEPGRIAVYKVDATNNSTLDMPVFSSKII